MRFLRILPCATAMLAVTLFVAPVARAVDDPHALSFNVRCSSCHSTHTPAGSNLTNASSNEALCLSCHNGAGMGGARFSMDGFIKADPANDIGTSHAWNVSATNAGSGAQAPQSAAMTEGLDAGKVICSTCHNQHHSDPGAVSAGLAGKQVKSSTADHVAGTGTGSVTAVVSGNANAKTYLLEIVAPGAAGAATFRLSNDGGISWYGYTGGSWVAYEVSTAPARTTGTNVALNDGTNVTVTFTGATGGSFTTGDRFRVGVSYPFLRVALDSGDNTTGTKFCRDCHRDRAMDHNAVNVWDGTMKSHPVGITLGANGAGTDRAVPLDANGKPQTGGADQDGNASNNLVLASDDTVQCLTCHAIHNADGNSNTQ